MVRHVKHTAESLLEEGLDMFLAWYSAIIQSGKECVDGAVECRSVGSVGLY